MDQEYKQIMREQLNSIAESLDIIAKGFTKIVEEGITIYTHEDGPEARN